MSELLAVYGTLRRGFHGHDILKNARFVWSGYTYLPYILVVKDCIPYLIPMDMGIPNRVFLEVYEVDKEILKIIDDYEDVSEIYIRVKIYIHPIGFAWLYISRANVQGDIVEEGDYLEYICRKEQCRYVLKDIHLCYSYHS